MKQFCFFVIILLLLTAAPMWAQDKVMQVHSGGSVAYEIATVQVDSITFREEEAEIPEVIIPVLIGKGYQCSFKNDILKDSESLHNLIITTSDEWNKLIAAVDFDDKIETDINFLAHQVIVVIDYSCGLAYRSIDITGIAEYADKIVITIETLKKGTLASAITRPYHIVKIPVSDKKIVFKNNVNRIPNCL